jgi:hypothetical protein
VCPYALKANHFAIHDRLVEALTVKCADRFWNEHNFVFRKPDGLYYHAKGATPAWAGFADDSRGLTLIPLNMAEPVLVTRGLDAANGLGFAPRGAGRNLSRSAYMRRHAGRTEAEVVPSRPRASTRASSAASPMSPSRPAPTRAPRWSAARSPSMALPRWWIPSSPSAPSWPATGNDAPWRSKKAKPVGG